MTKDAPLLEYVSPGGVALPEGVRVLTLEKGEGWVRVVFPMRPQWIHVLPAAIYLMKGVLIVVGILGIFLIVLNASHGKGGWITPSSIAVKTLLPILLMMGGYAFMCLGWAWYFWWRYRRWGKVSRVLTVTTEKLSLVGPGFFRRVRQREWPISVFTKVELRTLRWRLKYERMQLQLFFG